MTKPGNALLLVGSPKGSKSTSQALGTHLLERLQGEEIEVETSRINPLPISEGGRQELLRKLDDADIIVLAFPLYVDALPSPVVKTLELIAEHRKEKGMPKDQLLLAISNCGFPEPRHNDTALAICRRFAEEVGFLWAGGLGLGAGGSIGGQPLGKLGGMARNIRKSLELTAVALGQGKPVPQEAVNLMARPLVPAWIYVLLGHMEWRSQARKNGVGKQIDARPYSL